MNLLPIVEGHGDVEVVPIILRRILDLTEIYQSSILRPFRVSRYRIVKEGEVEKTIRAVLIDRVSVDGIIIVLDADFDCPVELGAKLRERVGNITQLPISVVIAKREIESWFLGSKESIRGVRGIRNDASSPVLPEEEDAKGKLRYNKIKGIRYIPLDDNPAFASQFDILSASKRCPSLGKLIRDIKIMNKIAK